MSRLLGTPQTTERPLHTRISLRKILASDKIPATVKAHAETVVNHSDDQSLFQWDESTQHFNLVASVIENKPELLRRLRAAMLVCSNIPTEVLEALTEVKPAILTMEDAMILDIAHGRFTPEQARMWFNFDEIASSIQPALRKPKELYELLYSALVPHEERTYYALDGNASGELWGGFHRNLDYVSAFTTPEKATAHWQLAKSNGIPHDAPQIKRVTIAELAVLGFNAAEIDGAEFYVFATAQHECEDYSDAADTEPSASKIKEATLVSNF